MLAIRGRDHRTRQHLFHRRNIRRRQGYRFRILAVDLRDRAPQLRELFGNAQSFFASSSPIYRQRLAIVNGVIKSAIVPVAGIGTRLLPATKSQPKEMLPVARKPIVQYVVEELVRNNIEQILFITGRNKVSIENHFDHDPELLRALTETNKKDLLNEVDFEALQPNFYYTRQPP